jgi:hypothetical protein
VGENSDAPTLTPLLTRLKSVVTKRVGLALGLWGEAGIGKSYTVQRLLAAVTCQSFSVHATVPFVGLSYRIVLRGDSICDIIRRGPVG